MSKANIDIVENDFDRLSDKVIIFGTGGRYFFEQVFPHLLFPPC